MDENIVKPKCFEGCNAPICPLIKNESIWYPDESICKIHKGVSEEFKSIRRKQRKIQRRAINRDRFFTADIIKNKTGVRKGVKGLDPNITRDSLKLRFKTQ